MEEKFDKLISLIEEQNKAWIHTINILTAVHDTMLAKYKNQELLLEQHPPVREPINEPVTVGNREQPQPFNDYNDTQPYGTAIEEERNTEAQSFPVAPSVQPVQQQQAPPAPSSPPMEGERVVSLEQPKQEEPLPAPQSKAEMLERQVTLPNS